MEDSGVERFSQDSYDVEVFRDGDELRVYIRTVVGLHEEALKAAESQMYRAVDGTDGDYCVKARATYHKRGLAEGAEACKEAQRALNELWNLAVEAKTLEGLPKVPGVVLDELARGGGPDDGNTPVSKPGQLKA